MSTRSKAHSKARSQSRPPSAPPSGGPTPVRRKAGRVWIALCLVAGLAAAGYSLWFWHQSSRPGMVHYLKGLDYAGAQQYPQARDEWLQGTREDPGFPQCWVELGDFNVQIHQYAEAARCYAAASLLLPNDGSVFLKLGQTENTLGDKQATADAARRAALLLPNDADAQALYGRVEADLHNLPTALAAIRRANSLRPGDPAIVRELAYQEFNLQDIAGAERDLAPYAQTHPKDADAAYLMALIATKQAPTPDNLRAGLRYAQAAVAGEPKDPDCLLVLGQLYLNANQPQKALQTFLTAVKIAPASEKILSGLVTSFTRTGDAKAAALTAAQLQQVSLRRNSLRHLVEALKLAPTDLTARLQYARLLEADGQFRSAQIQYERVVRDAPYDPRSHPALAAFLRRMGFPDRAREAARPDYVP